jgi:hypothetical protein
MMKLDEFITLLSQLQPGDSIFLEEPVEEEMIRGKMVIGRAANEYDLQVIHEAKRGGYIFRKPIMVFNVECKLIGDDMIKATSIREIEE